MSEVEVPQPDWSTFAPSRRQMAWIQAIRHAPPWLRRPLVRHFKAHVEPAWTSPLDVRVRGLRVRSHFSDNSPEYKLLFQGRRFDRWHVRHLTPLLRQASTFVDLGANFGFFSLVAAGIMRDRGTALAVEPNAEMARRMCVNIALNGCSNIQVLQAAIGGQEGHAVRDPAIADHGCAGYGAEAAGDARQPDADAIRLVPLELALREAGMNHVDVLKIDIEGYEDQALVPFFTNAPQQLWPAAILMENAHQQHWKLDLMGCLTSAGYRATAQTRVDVLLQRERSSATTRG